MLCNSGKSNNVFKEDKYSSVYSVSKLKQNGGL